MHKHMRRAMMENQTAQAYTQINRAPDAIEDEDVRKILLTSRPDTR